MPIDAIVAKIAAREVNEDVIPITSGVVILDNMNQNAYPKSILMSCSPYKYTVFLATTALPTSCHAHTLLHPIFIELCQ